MWLVIYILSAGLSHASELPSLTAEQLDAQLAATQRANLIEMGIVLVVFVAALGVAMWYVLREPKR